MPIGTVKWFHGLRGYGFIAPDDGPDVFVSVEQANRAGITPTSGMRIAFDVVSRTGKPAAENLVEIQD